MGAELKEKVEQCLNCKVKPCTKGCPLENNIPAFIEKVKQIKEKKKLYIFTLGNEIEEQELKEIKNYKIEAIPQKIYDKYKKTSKISNEK